MSARFLANRLRKGYILLAVSQRSGLYFRTASRHAQRERERELWGRNTSKGQYLYQLSVHTLQEVYCRNTTNLSFCTSSGNEKKVTGQKYKRIFQYLYKLQGHGIDTEIDTRKTRCADVFFTLDLFPQLTCSSLQFFIYIYFFYCRAFFLGSFFFQCISVFFPLNCLVFLFFFFQIGMLLVFKASSPFFYYLF